MSTHKHTQSACPQCGQYLSESTNVGDVDAHPKPGDFTFCLYCRAPLRFESDFTLRACSDDERAELAAILRGAETLQ